MMRGQESLTDVTVCQ